jgi:hypothetical protein
MSELEKAYKAEYRRTHPKELSAYGKFWNKANAEKKKKGQRSWIERNPGQVGKFCEKRKIRVLTHYGKGGRLLCCWRGCVVCDPDMLSIDHVNNDGYKDRSIRGTGGRLYRALEKEGYPEGFQTLCYNHQWKKETLRRRSVRQ